MDLRVLAVPLAAVLWLASATSVLDAQQIRGVVRDSTTGNPVPGAVISLVDAGGKVTARTIADAAGRFRTTRPTAATALQVLRIGFRPQKMVLPPAPAGQDVTDIVIALFPLPTLLETVTVKDRAPCSRQSDHDQALSLWEQARAALLASVVARDAVPAKVEMLVYDRELDRRGSTVVSQQVRWRSGSSTRPFIPARAPAAFAASGYVLDLPSGPNGEVTRTYDAPDADLLLDESFASTHCFRMAKGDGEHVGQLGLAFEPVSGRDTIADVAGILWLRPSPPALESIEFHYTGLEPAVMDAGAGGRISFRTTSNGVVFIDRWDLRMPILAPAIGQHRDPGAPLRVDRRANRDARVSEVVEHGGAVATVAWDDSVHWAAPLGVVRGRVISGDPGAPVAGAVIRLQGDARRTTANASGNFAFDRLLAGPYILQVSDSSLAAFGVTSTRTQRIEVKDSATVETTIELPSRDRAVEQICGRRLGLEHGAVVVTLENSPPSNRAAYVVEWSDASGSVFRAGRVDSVGHAAVCDVPANVPVGVTVRAANAEADTAVLLPRDRVAVVATTIGMTAANARSVQALKNSAAVLVVRVADTSNARFLPVVGAEVAVGNGALPARTDAQGLAVLRELPEGSHWLVVRALGRRPAFGIVEVTRDDSLDVSVRLTRAAGQLANGQSAAQLPAVQVQAEGDHPKLNDRLSGFEERRATGLGYFVTEDSITKRNPVHTTDLLSRIPGVRVSDAPGHVDERMHVYSSRDQMVLAGGNDSRSGKPCELAVWVNGQPMDTSFDINTIPPSAIHGIEVYHTSDTPPQFSALTTFTNACGSLVIWTK